jgi:hypothetical protein
MDTQLPTDSSHAIVQHNYQFGIALMNMLTIIDLTGLRDFLFVHRRLCENCGRFNVDGERNKTRRRNSEQK